MSARLKAKILIPGNLPDLLWYSADSPICEGLQQGHLVRVPLRTREVEGLVWELGSPDLHFDTLNILRVYREVPKFSDNWLDMLKWVSHYYKSTLQISLQFLLPKWALPHLLSNKSTLVPRLPPSAIPEANILTEEQSQALSRILPFLSTKSLEFHSFLLHGVTGSGKTLVYINLVAKCLDLGKNALVLLPEIAMTPLSIRTFQEHLQVPVFAYHSNLGAAQRRALWEGLRNRTVRVVIGVRSAVFCPLENLGLIVVDEEHDSSYKQSEAAPRYNARDVALYRGKQYKCPVILGSATPALETYHAALANKHSLLQMKQRATRAPLPRIHVVDMKEQLELQGDLPLSVPLREALSRTLDAGEQAILLLNRRGFSKIRLNKITGEPIRCGKCSVPLIPHKKMDRLLCHHCGFVVRKAFSDNAENTVDVGWALEKLEDYLAEIFPSADVLRLDRDSISRKGRLEKILSDFESGKANILIGTQMVAKGHDFKKANLVGVLDTDSGLGLPDFRAQEKMFQLITQVAGRAGRHSATGQVYLQTFQPDNQVIECALKNDYENFYRAELAHRKDLGYPPACKMIKIELTGPEETRVLELLENFAEILRLCGHQLKLRILGPGQAAIPKINGQYRSQIFVKCGNSNQLQWVVEESLKQFSPEIKHKYKLIVDVDPISVM